MKHWSALNTGLMPAEFTSLSGEKGLAGSGSMGGPFCGCWLQVSHVPSSSETRRRLSLNKAGSLSLSPKTPFGTGERGPTHGARSSALLTPPRPSQFNGHGAAGDMEMTIGGVV